LFKRAAAQDDRDRRIWELRAKTELALGNVAEALRCFLALLACNPKVRRVFWLLLPHGYFFFNGERLCSSCRSTARDGIHRRCLRGYSGRGATAAQCVSPVVTVLQNPATSHSLSCLYAKHLLDFDTAADYIVAAVNVRGCWAQGFPELCQAFVRFLFSMFRTSPWWASVLRLAVRLEQEGGYDAA
jgi:hypothetical protein